jgi:hypothetical protein
MSDLIYSLVEQSGFSISLGANRMDTIDSMDKITPVSRDGMVTIDAIARYRQV